MEDAFVAWIQSFKGIKVKGIEEIDDQILSEILTNLDSKWFKISKSTISSDSSSGWVFKFNHLKKLYKLLISYFEHHLNKSTSAFDAPNLNIIAKESGDNLKNEMIKFLSIIITLAVQLQDNQVYIEKIQSLSSSQQRQLMLVIDSTIAKQGVTIESSQDNDNIRTLQQSNKELAESNQSLLARVNELETTRLNPIGVPNDSKEINSLKAELYFLYNLV